MIAFLLAICMSSILITSASANEPGDLEMEENLATAATSGESDSILRYGEREVVTVLEELGRHTEITVPKGQDPGGYNFPNGGSIIIDPNGGSNVTISFAVTVAESISIGISTGEVAKPYSVVGLVAHIPADNHFYTVELQHDFILKRIRIDYYKGPEFLYSKDFIRAYPDGTSVWLKEVR